jgi:hypothetical protein
MPLKRWDRCHGRRDDFEHPSLGRAGGDCFFTGDDLYGLAVLADDHRDSHAPVSFGGLFDTFVDGIKDEDFFVF